MENGYRSCKKTYGTPFAKTLYYLLIINAFLKITSSQIIIPVDDQQTDDFEILTEAFPDKIRFSVNDSAKYEIVNVICRNVKSLELTEAVNNICFDLSPCSTYQSTITIRSLQSDQKFERLKYTETLYTKPSIEITGSVADVEEINLTWSTMYPSCISEYRIQLESVDKTYSWKLENDKFELLVTELNPCREHNLQLVGYDVNGDVVGNVSTTNTTLYAEPGNVNVTTEFDDKGQMVVSWQEPKYATCVSYYHLKWFIPDCYNDKIESFSIMGSKYTNQTALDNEAKLVFVPHRRLDFHENYFVSDNNDQCEWFANITDPNVKSYTITSLRGCELYEFEIYINSETNSKADPVNFTGPEQVPGSISLESMDIFATEITLYWKGPDVNPKCVAFYHVYLMGPIQRSEELQKEYLIDTKQFECIFTDLDPCGQYSLSITTISLNGSLGLANNITLETSESKPSAVRNVQIDAETEALNISWDPPSFADLCLDKYRLAGWIDETSSSQRFDNETKDPFARIEGLFSCQSYTVQIIAATINKDGEPTLLEVETQPKLATPNNIQALAQYPSALELSAVESNFNNKCETIIARFVCEESKQGNATHKTAKQYVEGQVKGVTFKAVLSPLSPYTSYRCGIALFNTAGWSQTSETILMTLPYYPDIPSRLALKASTNVSLSFSWNPPNYPNGNIKLYISYFLYIGPAYFVPPDCPSLTINPDPRETASLQLSFSNLLPYTIYSIQVAAQNEYGIGDYTRSLMVTTKPWISDPVKNLKITPEGPHSEDGYQANVIIEWLLPCKTNGEIDMFILQFTGHRQNYSTHYFQRLVTASHGRNGVVIYNETNLQPDYRYSVEIMIKTKDVEKHSIPTQGKFESPSGIPQKLNEESSKFVYVNAFAAHNPITTAAVRFPLSMLTTEWGSILYAAILVSEKGCNSVPNLRYEAINTTVNWPISRTWAEVQETEENGCIKQYQTTINRWDPKTSLGDNKSEVFFIIGSEKCSGTSTQNCSELNNCNEVDKTFCNGPLKPATEYYFVLRFFTKSGYNDVVLLEFRTDALFKLTVIGISIIGSLLLALFAGVIYIWITKRASWQRESCLGIEDSFGNILGKNFVVYYKELSKPEKILREFKELTLVAMDLSYSAAEMGCSKNRYADIFPYDKNRVILDIDAEGSDYINASFIDGYKHRKEYIATQGPKPESTMDFWRMILQYNVRIIVMVTQFLEGSNVKCHEYFPFKSKGVCVTIKKKESFDIYDRSELSISNKKYGMKQKVVHYLFKKWPDHGCPPDPTELISFIRKVKTEKVPSYSPIVVHCSAGVGRTGTFIGLDIIMQRLKFESKINIFETVKKLRFQRMKMVQTLEQYTFLYTCTYELVKNKYLHYLKAESSKNKDNGVPSTSGRKVYFEDEQI